MNDHFQIAYQVTDDSVHYFFLLICLSLAFIFYLSEYYKWHDKNKAVPKYIYVFPSLLIILGVVIGYFEISNYFKTISIYKSKKYNSIEGYVKNYQPAPNGHKQESFEVNNTIFQYSNFDESEYGYNKTQSNGGIIDNNMYVRIAYFDDKGQNIILRIEIKISK